MIKKLLPVLLAFFLLLGVVPDAGCSDNKTFVAVFANPGTKRLSGWDKVRPDLYVESGDWENLDSFLDVVKKKAGKRPIVIDLECHGSAVTGMLVIQFSSFGRDQSDTASVGYVIKKIMTKFKDRKNLEVCLEACHSSVCYSRTIESKATVESEDFHVDSVKGDVPFPVYGIGALPNINNFVYTQLHLGIKPFFHDLRQFKGKEIEPDFDEEKINQILIIFRTMYLYGNFNRN